MSWLPLVTSAAAPYVGPGDINGAAAFWVGLRAYSAAYATSLGACIDVQDTSLANTTTINVTAAGDLNQTQLGNFITNHGTPVVSKYYDQSGNGNHLVNTNGNSTLHPIILANSITGLGSTRPGMNFHGTVGGTQTTFLSAATGVTLAQTLSYSWVGLRISYGGAQGLVLGDTSNNILFGWGNSSNLITSLAGSQADVAFTTDNVWVATQGLMTSGGSVHASFYINGSAATSSFNQGSTNFASANGLLMGSRFNVSPDYINECGMWSGDVSANNVAMNGNQRTYWGF